MAYPVLRDWGTATTGGGQATSLDFVLDENVYSCIAGDIQFIIIGSDETTGAGPFSTSESGWVKLEAPDGSGVDTYIAIFVREADESANDHTTVTINSSGNDELQGIWGYVSSGSFADIVSNSGTDSASVWTLAALTGQTDTDWLVIGAMSMDGGDGGTITVGAPYTVITNVNSGTAGTDCMGCYAQDDYTGTSIPQLDFTTGGNSDGASLAFLAIPAGPTYIEAEGSSDGTSTVTGEAAKVIPAVGSDENLSVDTYYFDASVSGPTDPDSVWSDPDIDVFDGSISSNSTCSSEGTVDTSELRATGYSGPSSGDAISQVRVRISGGVYVADNNTLYAEILDGGTSLGIAENTLDYLADDWGDYVILDVPAGGWTWAKLNSIECVVYGNSEVSGWHKKANLIGLEVTSGELGPHATVTGVGEAGEADSGATEGNSDGTSTAAAVSGTTKGTVGSSDGTSNTQADTNVKALTELNSDGTSTAQADTTVDVLTELNSDGISTAQADASFQLFSSTDINSDGIATINGVGAADALTELNSDGSATVDGASAAYVPTDINSDGTSTVQADISDANAGSAANAAGVATADAYTQVIAQTTASSAGTSTITGTAASFAKSDTTIAGTSTVDANSSAIAGIVANLDATSTASALAAVIHNSDANSAGTATAQANTTATSISVASSSGLAITAANASVIWQTDTSSIAQATTSADSGAIILSTAQAEGASSTSGNSSNLALTDLNAAGTASTSGDAIAFSNSDADSSGTATVISATGATAKVVAASDGTSTAQANASDANAGGADADSAGIATVQADTNADILTDFNVSGTATVEGVSTADALTDFNVAGTSNVEGVGAADILTELNSDGSATVNGVSAADVLTELNSDGAATVTGIGAADILTDATSIGTSTAQAITPAIYEQEGYRFRNDDGTEITATWMQAQDVDISTDKLICKRLRIITKATGDPDTAQITLQYRKVGEGDWRNV